MPVEFGLQFMPVIRSDNLYPGRAYYRSAPFLLVQQMLFPKNKKSVGRSQSSDKFLQHFQFLERVLEA